MADFIKEISSLYQLDIEELNVGGGFGVYYKEGDERRSMAYFTELINKVVIEEFDKRSLSRPIVIIEPGRWICAEAGITLYTVGAIKDIQGIRKYVSIDGGMTDNIRPSLYGAKYTAIPVNYMKDRTKERVTIAGRCCESGDVIIRDIEMEKLESGDIIAVLSTGAYNYSMSSNYNRIPKPPVIMIDRGVERIVVKGETYDDILRNDI
jgi:diaminopimelate decarboxylase